MATFDFITGKEFRLALEADYKEMHSSIETGSWKCAQVVAGSVVEALLIDYLISFPNPGRPTKNPLSLDLGEAIAICKSEKILTERTAELCSVVRSYRNLIHPGRVIRLGEPAPERDSALIAVQLVEIITSEVAKGKRGKVGLTAEQILSKVERDSQSLRILKHLILEASEQQRERLLLEVFPQAHERHFDPQNWEDDIAHRVAVAHRMTFETVTDEIKMRVAAEYVRVLREGDGTYVDRYTDAFFRASDLEYVIPSQCAVVRDHLLSATSGKHTARSIKLVTGLHPYLVKEDASKWLDPIVQTLISPTPKEEFIRTLVQSELLGPFWGESEELQAALKARIGNWRNHFKSKSQVQNLEILDSIEGQLLFI